ncbi:hypothetical protein [Ruegeria sp. MALMAid1280]|uniref:hypothetical protein n=1 Tax=Ruegeria sp. MALMAid1280 TaxID=3411634 RepID=UPI003BA0679D
MSKEILLPKGNAPSDSYQKGLDEGHEGLTAALKEIVGRLPSAMLGEITQELDRCEETGELSPLAEKMFQRAIRLCQANQLMDARTTDHFDFIVAPESTDNHEECESATIAVNAR